MKTIFFVCVHNAGRSQMAAGFLNASGSTTLTAESAGTIPTEKVNPVVVDAMKEKGIDISGNRPQILTQGMADSAHQVITMGCSIEEACPATFMLTEDWGLDDPAGQPMEEVKRIRDQIEQKVKDLIEKET